jgi:hypothetical protein
MIKLDKSKRNDIEAGDVLICSTRYSKKIYLDMSIDCNNRFVFCASSRNVSSWATDCFEYKITIASLIDE